MSTSSLTNMLSLIITLITVAESMKFGFSTFSSTNTTILTMNQNNVTITLYWSSSKYQCTVHAVDAYYSCDTSDVLVTECSVSSIPVEYGMQIDNYLSGPLEIDNIFIEDDTNNNQTMDIDIDSFCSKIKSKSPSSRLSGDCQQHDTVDINRESVLFIIDKDEDKYNNYNAELMIMDEFAECDIPFNTTSLNVSDCIGNMTENTRWYGGSSGDHVDTDIDLGRIRGISSWGIENNLDIEWRYHAISNFRWLNSSIDHVIGTDPVEPCDPFILDTDDYIIGYRVIYGKCKKCLLKNNLFVNGLVFHTKLSGSYKCIANISDLDDEYIDTGDIYPVGSYLSGFRVRHSYVGGVVDAISLQFTKLCANNHIDRDHQNPISMDIIKIVIITIVALIFIICLLLLALCYKLGQKTAVSQKIRILRLSKERKLPKQSTLTMTLTPPGRAIHEESEQVVHINMNEFDFEGVDNGYHNDNKFDNDHDGDYDHNEQNVNDGERGTMMMRILSIPIIENKMEDNKMRLSIEDNINENSRIIIDIDTESSDEMYDNPKIEDYIQTNGKINTSNYKLSGNV